MQLTDSQHPQETEVLSGNTYFTERATAACNGLIESFISARSRWNWIRQSEYHSKKQNPQTVYDVYMDGLTEALKRMPSAVPEIFVPLEDILVERMHFESAHGSFFKEKIRYLATITIGRNNENAGVMMVDIHGPHHLDRYMETMPNSVRITSKGDFFATFFWGYPTWKNQVQVVTNVTNYEPAKREKVYSVGEEHDAQSQKTFDKLFEIILKVLEDISARATAEA